MGEPETGIDNLIRRVRQEAARRQHAIPAAAPPQPSEFDAFKSAAGPDAFRLPRWTTAATPRSIDGKSRVADFLEAHDESFVRDAYAVILGRTPDPEGSKHFLWRLRSGRWSKIDVLGQLRYSEEGRAKAVHVAGLGWSFALHRLLRIPILGPVLAWGYYLVSLPKAFHGMRRSTAAAERRDHELGRFGNELAEATEDAMLLLQERAAHATTELDRLRADIARKADAAELDRVRADITRKADAERISKVEADIDARIAAMSQRLAASDSALSRLQQTITGIDQALREKLDRPKVDELLARIESDHGRVANTMQSALATIRQEIVDQKRNILEVQRRLVATSSPLPSSDPATASQKPSDRPEADSHWLDAFYVSFEDHFRGSREEIKSRFTVYLDVVRNAHAGTLDAPVLDVACGRGEWLELLRDEGLAARGVDLNGVMVAECRERDLSVEQVELLAYLRSCPDGSVGAVTGFHIIEHLPFERIIELLDETRRVLRRGGVAIFETPNPENLIVASCNFYYDPTHRNPLPPEMMRFVMDARGFADTHVMRLRPVTLPPAVPDATLEIVRGMLSAAPDYAIVGLNV